MESDIRTALASVHRANVERYRRILDSYLNPDERRFVERRIAEEEARIAELTGSGAPAAAVLSEPSA